MTSLSTQHSARSTSFSPWYPRLLLAALLTFGSEVLAWTTPTSHTPLDWALRVVGYIALAALLLDFTMRYRVRDLFGGLALAGIYTLLYALLLNPTYAFADIGRTLVTRVMGAHGLLAAEMLGLFLALTGGNRPRTRKLLLVGAVIVGLAWGTWVRYWPPDEGLEQVPLATMLAYGIGGLALVVAVLFWGARRTASLTPDDLKLSRTGLGILSLVLLALFALRWLQGVLDAGAVIVVALILVICWAILWFRERKTGRSLLDGHIPINLPPLSTILPTLIIFFAATIFAYNLAMIQVGQVNQLTFIGIGFTAYGLAWLPTVSLVLGAQAYLRQISQRKM
jgi:hypothetical protein